MDLTRTRSLNPSWDAVVASLGGTASGLGLNFPGDSLRALGADGIQQIMQAALQQNSREDQQSYESGESARERNLRRELAQMGQQQQILNTLLQQSYIDQSQYETAMRQFDGASAASEQARGYARNLAENGTFTDAERARFDETFNPANEAALELAENGGISPEEWDELMGQYDTDRGRLSQVADRGALTPEEMDQIVSSGYQDVMDTHKAAAESTFNAGNLSGNPFAGAAVMAGGATAAGKNRASVLADTMKYQADSRLQGMGMLQDQLEGRTNAYMGRADNRVSGVNAAAGMLDRLGNFLTTDAEGRQQGIGYLNDLVKTETQLAAEKAALAQKTMPGYVQNVLQTATNNYQNPTGPMYEEIPKEKKKKTTGGTTFQSSGQRFGFRSV